MNKVLIAGGGAAGMMAAVMAAREGCAVTLFEKMKNWARRYLSQEKVVAI